MKLATIAILCAAVLASALVYPALPDEMPVHWNVRGEVDGTMAKPFAPFFLPLIIAATAALFLALPRISPRGFEIEAGARAYRAMLLGTLLFLFALHLVMLASALGYRVSIPLAVPMLTGALLALLGNYMAKVPRNFFIGVRTPWTLADEDVWFRTHRLASKTFVLAGLAIAIGALFLSEQRVSTLILTAVLAAALVPAVYSYVIYRGVAR